MNDSTVFLLERYKYIMSRKESLNEATFKIAAVYQAVLGGLVFAQYSVFLAYSSKGLGSALSLLSTYCIAAMFFVLTILILCLLVGGVVSWLNYRDDEAEIEFKVFGVSRVKPKLRDIFGWYETYIALIVVLIFFSGAIFYCNFVFPALMS